MLGWDRPPPKPLKTAYWRHSPERKEEKKRKKENIDSRKYDSITKTNVIYQRFVCVLNVMHTFVILLFNTSSATPEFEVLTSDAL